MRRTLVAVLLSLSVCGGAAGEASAKGWQLLMFDAQDCAYCERWHDEIGVIYAKTAEGALAPLLRVDFDDPLPAGVRLRRAVQYTPTFVLLAPNGAEAGRITGYLGEEQFWGLMEVLLRRIDDAGVDRSAVAPRSLLACGNSDFHIRHL